MHVPLSMADVYGGNVLREVFFSVIEHRSKVPSGRFRRTFSKYAARAELPLCLAAMIPAVHHRDLI
jgi:hypothetical protein